MQSVDYKKPTTTVVYEYKWKSKGTPIVHILNNRSDGTKEIYTSEDV